MTVHRLEVPWFCLVERDSIGVIVTLFPTSFCAPISSGFACEGEVTVLTGPTSYRELWPSFHEWMRTCAHVSFLWVTLFKKLDLEYVPRHPWSYSHL